VHFGAATLIENPLAFYPQAIGRLFVNDRASGHPPAPIFKKNFHFQGIFRDAGWAKTYIESALDILFNLRHQDGHILNIR